MDVVVIVVAVVADYVDFVVVGNDWVQWGSWSHRLGSHRMYWRCCFDFGWGVVVGVGVVVVVSWCLTWQMDRSRRTWGNLWGEFKRLSLFFINDLNILNKYLVMLIKWLLSIIVLI